MEAQKQKNEEVNVRLANLDDFEKLNYVYERDFIKHNQPLAKFPLTEWISSNKFLFPIAETKNKILGFMVFRFMGGTAKIDKFSVLKSYTSKGIVKQLFSFAEPMLLNRELIVYLPKSKSEIVKQFHALGFRTYDEVKQLFGKNGNGILLKKSVIEKKKIERKIKKEDAVEDKVVQERIEIASVPAVFEPAAEEEDPDKYYFM